MNKYILKKLSIRYFFMGNHSLIELCFSAIKWCYFCITINIRKCLLRIDTPRDFRLLESSRSLLWGSRIINRRTVAIARKSWKSTAGITWCWLRSWCWCCGRWTRDRRFSYWNCWPRKHLDETFYNHYEQEKASKSTEGCKCVCPNTFLSSNE